MATTAYGSSSVNGAPGRSDFNKRRAARAVPQKAAIEKPRPAPVAEPVMQAPAPTVVPAPVRVEDVKTIEAAAPPAAITYADVLTDKQKDVLRKRAEVLGLPATDFEKLLAPDEKEQLDTLVKERANAVAAGE